LSSADPRPVETNPCAVVRRDACEARQRLVTVHGKEVSLAAWAALRRALELFIRICPNVPPFSISWDPPDFPRATAAALTDINGATGEITMALRSDLPPAEIERVVWHEMQHIADAERIVNGELNEAQYEERAQRTEDFFARLRRSADTLAVRVRPLGRSGREPASSTVRPRRGNVSPSSRPNSRQP
jgi:hypothetical protein